MRQRYIPYIKRALLFTSGIFIGVNNYEFFLGIKDRITAPFVRTTTQTTYKTQIETIEDLINLEK